MKDVTCKLDIQDYTARLETTKRGQCWQKNKKKKIRKEFHTEEIAGAKSLMQERPGHVLDMEIMKIFLKHSDQVAKKTDTYGRTTSNQIV